MLSIPPDLLKRPSCYFQISTSVLWLIIFVPRVAPIVQTLLGHSIAPAKLHIYGTELNVKVCFLYLYLLYGNSISWSFRDEISKPLTNKRLFEPSFPRLFVCLYVRHYAFPLKRWNRPLPSSRTSVIWCRNYDVRTRLSENSSSSLYRTKSRVSENVRKFLEIRRWRLKHHSWERSI